MPKRMSIRARKYINNKMLGLSDYQSAIKAGYSKATALNARKNIENHGVKQTMSQAMDECGITNYKLATMLREGLEATITLN